MAKWDMTKGGLLMIDINIETYENIICIIACIQVQQHEFIREIMQ